MPEPTTGSAAAALTVAAASTALGIEGGPLLWAFIGATLGVSWAPAASRLRFWTVFACVVLACSVCGAFLGAYWFDTKPELATRAGNVFALALAWLFHPVSAALVARVPDLIEGFMRKAGLRP